MVAFIFIFTVLIFLLYEKNSILNLCTKDVILLDESNCDKWTITVNNYLVNKDKIHHNFNFPLKFMMRFDQLYKKERRVIWLKFLMKNTEIDEIGNAYLVIQTGNEIGYKKFWSEKAKRYSRVVSLDSNERTIRSQDRTLYVSSSGPSMYIDCDKTCGYWFYYNGLRGYLYLPRNWIYNYNEINSFLAELLDTITINEN